MPIYEYACNKCGHESELWQKITDKPARTCPHCGARGLKRLISNTTFKLKGTGWYVTDYTNKKPPSASSSPKPKSEKSKKSKAGDTSDKP